MKNLNLTFCFVLLTSLYIPSAMAGDIAIPDKDHRQGMSYEEYASYREKMRLRMGSMSPEKGEKPNRNSTYGQGYQARQRPTERPSTGAENRAERPHFERFNRSDMGRR